MLWLGDLNLKSKGNKIIFLITMYKKSSKLNHGFSPNRNVLIHFFLKKPKK